MGAAGARLLEEEDEARARGGACRRSGGGARGWGADVGEGSVDGTDGPEEEAEDEEERGRG